MSRISELPQVYPNPIHCPQGILSSLPQPFRGATSLRVPLWTELASSAACYKLSCLSAGQGGEGQTRHMCTLCPVTLALPAEHSSGHQSSFWQPQLSHMLPSVFSSSSEGIYCQVQSNLWIISMSKEEVKWFRWILWPFLSLQFGNLGWKYSNIADFSPVVGHGILLSPKNLCVLSP